MYDDVTYATHRGRLVDQVALCRFQTPMPSTRAGAARVYVSVVYVVCMVVCVGCVCGVYGCMCWLCMWCIWLYGLVLYAVYIVLWVSQHTRVV